MTDNCKVIQGLKGQLAELFRELDFRIEEMNRELRTEGRFAIPKAKVRLLGQVSLLNNDLASMVLSLAHTGDLDALLVMENVVKDELKAILKKFGMVYDEDSYLIWIPPGAKFLKVADLENVLVDSIDPESALVSKAVKAPKKNKQLIREAIASDAFPTLVDRILKNGGKLEDFA